MMSLGDTTSWCWADLTWECRMCVCVCVWGQGPGGSGADQQGGGLVRRTCSGRAEVRGDNPFPGSGLKAPWFWWAELDFPGCDPSGLGDGGGWGVGGQRVSQGPIPTRLGSARPFPKGVHHGENEELSPPTTPAPPIPSPSSQSLC